MPLCKTDTDSMTQAYHKVKGLILQSACKFYHKTHRRFDLDELICEANSMFMKAWRTYDETKKTKFSTWVAMVVWTGLEHWSVRESKVQQRYKSMFDEEGECINEPGYYDYNTFFVEDLLCDLSPEAQELIKLALDLPQELQEEVRSTRGGWNGHTVKASIRKHLKRLGWSHSKIRRTVDEVKTVIRNYKTPRTP